LWVVESGIVKKPGPLAVERRLDEMPSSLYGAGLPTCSIQFLYLRADSSLARAMLSVSFSTIQSDDYAHCGWGSDVLHEALLLRFACLGRVWVGWKCS
jgi:hypothetical protein